MPIRCTCSHCGCESYHDSSSGAFGQNVVALANRRCVACGRTGVLITLNVQPPPNARIVRDGPADRRPHS